MTRKILTLFLAALCACAQVRLESRSAPAASQRPYSKSLIVFRPQAGEDKAAIEEVIRKEFLAYQAEPESHSRWIARQGQKDLAAGGFDSVFFLESHSMVHRSPWSADFPSLAQVLGGGSPPPSALNVTRLETQTGAANDRFVNGHAALFDVAAASAVWTAHGTLRADAQMRTGDLVSRSARACLRDLAAAGWLKKHR